jgi:hypothetical protein
LWASNPHGQRLVLVLPSFLVRSSADPIGLRYFRPSYFSFRESQGRAWKARWIGDFGMASTWFLKQGQRELGPLSVGQLHWLAQRGKLNASDQVRGDDSDQWARLPDIEELAMVWQASHESAAPSQPSRRKDHRWRDSDEDDAASRSARLSRPTVPMKAPPRQQAVREVTHRPQLPGKTKEDVYARHRLAKWRARRSYAGTLWSWVCLVLVGVISAGGGAWMMSRLIRGVVADSPTTNSTNDDLPDSPATHAEPTVAGSKRTELFRVEAGLTRRLSQIASWIHAERGAWESPGRTRLEVTNAWTETGRSADDGTYSKVLFQIRLANLDDRKTRQYNSWNLLNREGTLLLDASNRSCPMVSLAEDPRVERKSRVNAAPGTSITDVLVFCIPKDFGDELRLVLPLAAAGDTGYVGFIIPRDQLKERPPIQIERHNPVPAPLLRPSRNPRG